MKLKMITAAIAAILATSAWAQPGPGMMGGMMGGYGPGDCGYGMGPGMMGGMGPGMMGGMGPGMMGGMGPGMMGGYGPRGYYGLKLSDEQRRKIADILQEQWRKQWALMGSMHELRSKQLGAEESGKFDDAQARKNYQAMADLQKQMFENSLETRKRIDAVLTQEQREELKKSWGGR
jgi:Spy/CpxP family protein refolding chaperone